MSPDKANAMQTRHVAYFTSTLLLLWSAPAVGQDTPFGFVGNSASVLPLSAPTHTETGYIAGDSGVVRLPADYFGRGIADVRPEEAEPRNSSAKMPAWFVGGLGAMLLLGLALTGLCVVRRTGRSATAPPRISFPG
jgi:hypothetical protein